MSYQVNSHAHKLFSSVAIQFMLLNWIGTDLDGLPHFVDNPFVTDTGKLARFSRADRTR